MGSMDINQEAASVGSVKIADDVVGMIVALAASEIEGVHSVGGDMTTELLGKVGMRTASRGVKVDVSGKKVRANISIVMEYGFNIPVTCQKVQERVKSSVENMTGLDVVDVNVKISGISAPGR